MVFVIQFPDMHGLSGGSSRRRVQPKPNLLITPHDNREGWLPPWLSSAFFLFHGSLAIVFAFQILICRKLVIMSNHLADGQLFLYACCH